MTETGKQNPLPPPEWLVSSQPVPYLEALEAMEKRVLAIQEGKAPELVWLLEHPPLYTAGTSARAADLLNPRFPVFETGRGGQYTYHGPGQRVIYAMLDLNRRGKDVRCYVHNLEEWIIQALKLLGIDAVRREGRVGLWVPRDQEHDDKIAAIGVRVKRWVTMHGAAINVAPDLSHYAGIVPCGIREHGITSLEALGKSADITQADAALKATWNNVFGNTSADLCSGPSPGL